MLTRPKQRATLLDDCPQREAAAVQDCSERRSRPRTQRPARSAQKVRAWGDARECS